MKYIEIILNQITINIRVHKAITQYIVFSINIINIDDSENK